MNHFAPPAGLLVNELSMVLRAALMPAGQKPIDTRYSVLCVYFCFEIELRTIKSPK
jgi:hypothetical protein